MRHRALIGLLLLAVGFATPRAAIAEDCLPLLTAAVVRQLGTNADAVFRLAARSPEVSDGIAAALRAREKAADAGIRLSAIIQFFGSSAEGVFLQLGKVKHANELSKFVANLSASDSAAQGAAATLRYVTTRMTPSSLQGFEFPISGAVADAVDTAGNLLEVKSLNFAPDAADFLVRVEYVKIRDQVTSFRDYAVSQGKRVTLVFEASVLPAHRSVFDEVLGDLISHSSVTFVNGF